MNIFDSITSLKTEIAKKLKLTTPPEIIWKKEKFQINIQETHYPKNLQNIVDRFGIFYDTHENNQTWYHIKHDYLIGLTEKYYRSSDSWKPTAKNRKILITVTGEAYNQHTSLSWLRVAAAGNCIKNYHNFINDQPYYELIINDYIPDTQYKKQIWKSYKENKQTKNTIINEFLSYLNQKHGDNLKQYNFEIFCNTNLGGFDQFLFDQIVNSADKLNIEFDSATFYHDLEENSLIENYVEELKQQNKISIKENITILKNTPHNHILKIDEHWTTYPFQQICKNIRNLRKFDKTIQLTQNRDYTSLQEEEHNTFQLSIPGINIDHRDAQQILLEENPDSFVWTNIGIDGEISLEDAEEYLILEETLENIKKLYKENIYLCASLNECWQSWNLTLDNNLQDYLMTPTQNYYLLQILNWKNILKQYEKTYNPIIIQDWIKNLHNTYQGIYNNNKFIDIDDKIKTGHWMAILTMYLFAVHNSFNILGIEM